jgi:Mitochondrial carrier protein
MQLCTIPLDTAKVRLQLQKNAASSLDLPKYRGMLGTVATIAREEGSAALWKGIVPGLQRQCIYGGLRIGLYEPVSLSLSLCSILFTFFFIVIVIILPVSYLILIPSCPEHAFTN